MVSHISSLYQSVVCLLLGLLQITYGMKNEGMLCIWMKPKLKWSQVTSVYSLSKSQRCEQKVSDLFSDPADDQAARILRHSINADSLLW